MLGVTNEARRDSMEGVHALHIILRLAAAAARRQHSDASSGHAFNSLSRVGVVWGGEQERGENDEETQARDGKERTRRRPTRRDDTRTEPGTKGQRRNHTTRRDTRRTKHDDATINDTRNDKLPPSRQNETDTDDADRRRTKQGQGRTQKDGTAAGDTSHHGHARSQGRDDEDWT
ncbi:unnamed protein product, partial [Arctogadus glacialis]